ncbi:MAG: ATP-binding protein [Desulfobacteraceae bacterium]|jgi:PAS domain S-box-containing protein|nr:ATP-binding protein [Desulfobacteraceae bacterium]
MNGKPTYAQLEERIKELEHLKQIEQNRLLSFFESIPVGIYINDRQCNVQYVNPVIKKEFGTIDGRKCYSYLYDRSDPCPWCRNDAVFAGKPLRWDRYSKETDRYYDLLDMPFKNPDGSVSKIQIFNDITELKKTQETLKEKVRDAEIRARELSCLLEISKLFDQYGASLKEIHQGIVEIILRSWQYPDITCVRLKLEDKEVVSRNFKNTPWQLTTKVIVYGKTYGRLVVGYLEERPAKNDGPFLAEEKEMINAITKRLGKVLERKQVEEKLLNSERRFRNLTENSPTAISIMQDDKIVYRNPASKALTGALNEISLFTSDENLHSDDVQILRNHYRKLISGEKQKTTMSFRFYPVDEANNRLDMKWVHCMASVIEYRGKNSILTYMLDFTKAKKLEDMLKVQEKLASLGRVAAGIAHEIRNPLSGINIYLTTLKKMLHNRDIHADEDKISKILSQLQSASNKIESVIKRVMDFSRPGEPNFTLTNINHPVTEAFNLSSVTLRKTGIRLTTDLSPDLPECSVDPQMIEQVILNLITNAAEAMRDMDHAKKIVISSFSENDSVCISVSDSGPGIGKELYNQIFDPFYTTKSNSSGIGLSICSRIITDQGGSIKVTAGNLGGAEFIIKLPVNP